MEKAFALAESGQPGPVLVNVPMDFFSVEIDPALWQRQMANAKTLIKPSIDDETARAIVERLINAKNPVIYAGGGVMLSRAFDELRELVDHLDLPVAYSLMGKGAVPDTHPLVLGMTGFWGTPLTNQTTLNADWILGLGTRFKEADCSSWYPDYTFNIGEGASKLIHIDIEPQEIGRNYPVEIGAVADLKSALKVLVRVAKEMKPEGINRPELRKVIDDFRKDFAKSNLEMQQSDAFPMMPERILADLRDVMPDDAS